MYDIEGIEEYTSSPNTENMTRIEMLIEVYQFAIDQLVAANELIQQGDETMVDGLLLRAVNAIHAIYSGVDVNDEIGFNVARLCHFVTVRIQERKLDDAIMVLQNLKSGFEGIKAEANQLEANGIIPAIDRVQEVQVSI